MHALYAPTVPDPAVRGLEPAAKARAGGTPSAAEPADPGFSSWSAGPDAGTAAALGGASTRASPHAPEIGVGTQTSQHPGCVSRPTSHESQTC